MKIEFAAAAGYLFHNYHHHNKAAHWYGKQDIDNGHAHECNRLCFRKNDSFVVA
jgi:hypothetical protein